VTPARYRALVTGFGEAVSRYQVELAAQVEGPVVELSEGFESGRRVQAGDLLLRIDATPYRAAVAAAEKALAEARVSLLEEERQVAQAKAEWAGSGLKGKPDSALVLRQPQLAAAQAAVNEAEAALAEARQNLGRTNLTAPFDALVVKRTANPGDRVQAGDSVGALYSTDRVEVAVGLSERDWGNLPSGRELLAGDWPVALHAVEGDHTWQGRVLRSAGNLDAETRQRALIVGLEMPLDQQPPLYPGTFVALRLQGREQAGLWRLPNTALSQRGEIWYVDGEGLLDHFDAKPRFSDADFLYIEPPAALANAPRKVLIQPLNSYLKGMSVTPVQPEERDDA